MKYLLFPLMVCATLSAEGIFDSDESFNAYLNDSNLFYREYVAEQKDINNDVELSGGGNGGSVTPFNPPVNPFAPPANPTTPPAQAGYFPVVIVNNSGFDDNRVFISVIGTQLTGTTLGSKMYVTFNASGDGTYQIVSGSGSVTPAALNTLNTVPIAPHTYVIYFPDGTHGASNSDGISGARIYFEINDNTPLITYSGGTLTEPSVLNQQLSSYSITFDKYEFAYVAAGSPQIGADATAVDFFSVPLYGYLSTPNAGSSSNSGLYQPQSHIMKTVVPYYFNNRPSGDYKTAIAQQWNNLFSPNPSNPIRVLSPAQAMSVGTSSSFPNKFDPNYFDNEAAYGFSPLKYLWYGTNSFYRNNHLYFAIPLSTNYSQPAGGYYSAGILSGGPFANRMVFTPAFDAPDTESYFPAPSTTGANAPSPTNGPTSYLIFAALNLNSTFAANLQGNQVSKLFEEALVAGLLPALFTTTSPLSDTFFTNNTSNYYKNQNKLPHSAGGPWYSLYSEAMHSIGPIYAFGFDEPLYPEVLMESNTVSSSPVTFLGITIGLCDLVPQ
jgi:hypothetical protein